MIMGMKADDLAAIKEGGDESRFNAAVTAAKWGVPYQMTLQAKSREYNGENKMRYSVMRCEPLNYVAESRRMIEALKACC